MFARFVALPADEPGRGQLQRLDDRRAAAGAELVQPGVQFGRGLLPLPQPARLRAAGFEHGQAGALAVGAGEQLGEQALGLGQGTVAAGAGRGIDDD